ncbi:MAG TPA: MATE family efflux transporter [Gemmatimonadaceae bacterium]|nr:MATE family efflux transporter [Gemmatimonadaceae bacterium]
MNDPAKDLADSTIARPPEEDPTAALPLNPREGALPVAITDEAEVASALAYEPLPRLIGRLAIPAVGSNLLMTLFVSIDGYWVGTRVGSEGLAAVSTSVFWVWMMVASAEMISIGLTAVAARRHGEGRHGEAALNAGEALLYALALGTVIAIAGTLLVDHAFSVMQTSPEVSALGRRYLGTYILGAPLIFGFFAVDAAFRASGNTRTPFVLLGISVSVTLVLDPILILGLFGVPAFGIAGAAMATVGTRGMAFLLGLAILWRQGLIRFGPVRARTLALISRIGLPTAMTGITFSLIYVAITRTATEFGTPALAALGIGHRVESWLYMAAVGGGAAAAAIVGQNLGAGQVARAERTGWLTMGYASFLGILMSIAQLTLAEQLAGLFTNDPAVIAEGASYLRIVAVSQLFLCAEIVLEGALGGAGDTVPPMIASTGITVLRIPLAIWAASHWGTEGIWWTISLTAVARGVAMAILWRSGRWKRRSV